MKWALAVAVGIVVGSLSWAVAASAPDSYTKIEANSLLRTPQNAWARAILFSDALVAPPGKRARRLDRKIYFPMRLKEAGTVWVPEDLAPKFATLEEGTTYSFAGTVDQISRRYYVIVDACYTVQTTTDMAEHWIDMLHPEVQTMAPQDGLSETAMQSLLLSAQNSLITLAEEKNVSVAQLIEAQSDGGQRIAEQIVADALRGELRAQGKTADELMIGAVLALLQKQAVLDESARIAQEEATVEPVAEVRVESVTVAETQAEPGPEATDFPMTEGVAGAEESPPVPVEEAADLPAEEAGPDAVEPETIVDVAQATAPESDGAIPDEEPTKEAAPVAALPEDEMPLPKTEAGPPETDEPALAEAASDAEQEMPEAPTPESDVAELPPSQWVVPEPDKEAESPGQEAALESKTPAELMPDSLLPEGVGDPAQEEPPAVPPTSLLVGPLTDALPEMVPMVSTEPTKAEIAQMQNEEKARLKEEKRLAAIEAKRRAAEEKKAARLAKIEAKRRAAEEKKAAAAELARQRKIERQAKAEADRLAAEEKKAAAAARKAELARKKADALRAREEEAARKAAEWKAKKEAARAEAKAKKLLAEQERALAQQEKEALEAVRQAEIMAQQEEEARRLRKETEQRMAELEARKAVAEAALAEAEAQRQANLKRIQEDAAAKAAAEAAEQAARLAEKEARQAEALRIAQEVAAHERQAAEEAAVRVAAEQAARQAAEKRMAEMQREIEQMQAQARETKAASIQLAQPERAAEPATPPPSGKPMDDEQLPLVDPADLPEWMQPVVF